MVDEIKVIEDIQLENPKTIVVNGEVTSLSNSASKKLRDAYIGELEKDLQKIKDSTKIYVSQIRSKYEKKESELDDIVKNSFQLPGLDYVTSNEIVYGKYGDGIRFILPFRYAPVSIDGKRIVNPKRLERNIKIIIDITGKAEKAVKAVELVNNNLNKFEHYHQYSYGDCLGTLEKHSQIKNFDDVINYRNQVQNLYSDIHIEREGADNHTRPNGLPSLGSIETSSEVVLWKPENQQVVQDNGVWHVDGRIEEIRNDGQHRELLLALQRVRQTNRRQRVHFNFNPEMIIPILMFLILTTFIITMIQSAISVLNKQSTSETTITPTVMTITPTPTNPIQNLDDYIKGSSK